MSRVRVSVPAILQEIQTNVEFSEDMKNSFPDIEKSIDQYKNNPLCKCRKEIQSFFMKKVSDELLMKFVNKWRGKTKASLIGEEIVKDKPVSIEKKVLGDVLEIPAEPQAYKKLIEHATEHKWIYNTISVLEKEKEGHKVWLVFFG